MVHTEGVLYDAGDVVREYPQQAVVQLRVHVLHVVQQDGLAQQHLVERHDEAAVQVVAVEDGHADDATHKMEV